MTSADLLHEVETGRTAPDRRLIVDLDRKLSGEGVLWDAWAQALITDELSAGATVADLIPSAQQIRVYAPLVLPDAFLTEGYARAVNRAERPMEPNHYLHDRPQTSRLMPTTSGPPFYCVVADAAALTRIVGSVDVTRKQWEFLHALASGDRVSLHVIPHGASHHPGLRGAFWTLSFSPRHAFVHTPHPRGPGHLVTDASLVKGYADLFATLQGAALSAPDSLRFLEKLLRSREPGPKAIGVGPEPAPSSDHTSAPASTEPHGTVDVLRFLR
ncbi:DUF5753 domain-containing protein [Nocardiopsis sp. NPDC050513]|uniref:DUF5753 domain-containing protein n=1 Tax=Nocardiopsis sp. NPDC050513 TaxID=3364338 RepID=UPI0037AC2795